MPRISSPAILILCLLASSWQLRAQSAPPVIAPSPQKLEAWHTMTASVCHPAGSKADHEMSEALAEAFRSMGLEVEKQEIHPFLSRPLGAELEILSEPRKKLSLRESDVDDFSGRAEVDLGYNAYSASGEVRGAVVYANYGRREDFEKLKELGVDCRGKIVLARYGGNYRGYKAVFAEKAGAAGLVIFTDPADSGWRRGLAWPEGGWANGTSIQRGSIKTGDYFGDPLTPGVEAGKNARRIAAEDFPFPKIPVQPVGWNAAQEILSRMDGRNVPNAWQGGLPFRYRLDSSPKLQVRLKVEQERYRGKTFNIVATVPGSSEPERKIIFGSHHDAWTFGAGDPCAGVMVVLEAARVCGEMLKAGWRPKRSIVFALWGAEEHGIIGSVEWIEKHLADLRKNAVCYINLDAAAMGPNVHASASPSLQRVIAEAAAQVQDTTENRSILEGWLKRSPARNTPGIPRMGDLGGGSDHVGFLAQVGIPAAGIGAGGSAGTSYHSAYDNLDWYRKTVGEDYASGRMVTEWVVEIAKRLGCDPILPLDPAQIGRETRRQLERVSTLGVKAGLWKIPEGRQVATPLAQVEAAALQLEARAESLASALKTARSGAEGPKVEKRVDAALLQLDRAWMNPKGLPGRPWFQNLYAAPDEASGYASWMLPTLRHIIDHQKKGMLQEAARDLLAVFTRLEEALSAADAALKKGP